MFMFRSSDLAFTVLIKTTFLAEPLLPDERVP